MRIRSKILGSSERPRLCVKKSLRHIYAQVINDVEGKTLAAASTMDKQVRTSIKNGGNRDAAAIIGKLIADRAKEAGVKTVVFDRGIARYHGRIKSLAEAAREGGLEF